MNLCDLDLYTLPTLKFVGGETQDLKFNVYKEKKPNPFNLSGCTANFSLINYVNNNGTPLISKSMSYSGNVLSVTISPKETVNLNGKYIYQITIKDQVGSSVEIPDQGIAYIANNINKNFIAGA